MRAARSSTSTRAAVARWTSTGIRSSTSSRRRASSRGRCCTALPARKSRRGSRAGSRSSIASSSWRRRPVGAPRPSGSSSTSRLRAGSSTTRIVSSLRRAGRRSSACLSAQTQGVIECYEAVCGAGVDASWPLSRKALIAAAKAAFENARLLGLAERHEAANETTFGNAIDLLLDRDVLVIAPNEAGRRNAASERRYAPGEHFDSLACASCAAGSGCSGPVALRRLETGARTLAAPESARDAPKSRARDRETRQPHGSA